MSNTVFNARITAKHDTTENWNAYRDFIPLKGEMIVYDDYQQLNGTSIPGIKIGDGLAYLIDLPFITDSIYSQIESHINNTTIHVATFDRINWDNKITAEVKDDNLFFSI